MAVRNPNGSKANLIGFTRDEEKPLIALIYDLLIKANDSGDTSLQNRIGEIVGVFIRQGNHLNSSQYATLIELVERFNLPFEPCEFDDLSCLDEVERKQVRHFGERRASYRVDVLTDVALDKRQLMPFDIFRLPFVNRFAEAKKKTMAGEKDEKIALLEATIADQDRKLNALMAKLEGLTNVRSDHPVKDEPPPIQTGSVSSSTADLAARLKASLQNRIR